MPADSGAIADLPRILGQAEALVLVATAEHILKALPAERLVLPPEESERIARYKSEADRRTRLAAHALTRHCLGAFLGRQPRDLHFRRDEKGRPFLDSSGIDFNISHSHHWIAVGFSTAGRIGVDVQEGSETFDWKAVSRAFLHEAEIETIRRLPAAQQPPTALELWCLKEAFLKATGEGLATPPYRLHPERVGAHWHLTHQTYELKADRIFLPDASCAAWASEDTVEPRVILL